MNIKDSIKGIVNNLPYIKRLYNETEIYRKNSCFPAGHFYSPIVSTDEISKRVKEIWGKTDYDGIKGIDLNTEEQLKLLKTLSAFYNELPFDAEKKPNLRYQFNNGFYSYTDGIVLYSMIRNFKPKNIIEIGSGFSSAVMLDTNSLFFNNQINLTFIEPYTDRLNSLLTNLDKEQTKIIESDVQLISLDLFKNLEAGDILFVDSTHIVKTGSDVNYILFEILPVLNSGVLIHFHDIFYPFEYPKEWVLEGRNWNEDYFLKAFLMYNKDFKIRLFSDYIHKHHTNNFENMPLCYKNTGGNIWIEKT